MPVPISPQAIEAAVLALEEGGLSPRPVDVEKAIQAFLAAEGIEEKPRYDLTVGVDAIKEVRLCGPWRRVDG